MGAPATLPADFFDKQQARPSSPDVLPANFFDDPIHAQPATAEDLPSREQFEASHQDAVRSWWQKAMDTAGAVADIGSAAGSTVLKKAEQMTSAPLVSAGDVGAAVSGALGFGEKVGRDITAGQPNTIAGALGAQPPPGAPTMGMTAGGIPLTVPEGAAKGGADLVSGLTSPQNIGLGALMGPVAKIAPLLSRAVGAGFGVQMLKSVYDQSPEVQDAIAKKDWPRAAEAITKAAGTGLLGVAAGLHTAGVGAPPEAARTAEPSPIQKATASARAGVEAMAPDSLPADFFDQATSPASPQAPAPDALPGDFFDRSAGAPVESNPPAGNIPARQAASSTPDSLPAGFFDSTPAPAKPLWEMSPNELDAAAAEAKNRDQADLQDLFGPDGAKQYSRLERAANSTTKSQQETAAASDQLEQMEAGLTQEQRNRLYGIGDDRPQLDDIRGYQQALGQVDTSSPEALGESLKWAVTGVGDKDNPAEMTPEEQLRYAQLRHGMSEASAQGWDPLEVSQAAFRGAAGRFSPEDAAFMLRRFAQPEGQPVADTAASVPREPATVPAIGRDTNVLVPGESTVYPARYAIRELSDVQPSHNAFSFEPNPAYDYTNDRDYSRTQNAARVVKNAAPDTFNPDFPTTDSPTAEHGAPIIDASGNVLGGNSRAMTLAHVYDRGGADADAYRNAVMSKAQQFGIDPGELDRFKKPVLVREVGGGVDAQRAITDFNKAAPAALSPEEQAVADGRRLSPQTVQDLAGRLDDLGDSGTLAEALRGDDGAAVLNRLVRDGVMTEQEKGGYLDDRGNLTTEAKSRIGKALVGRLFDSPAEFRETTPAVRAKLERIAPQLLRVEGRPEWSLTDTLRQAIALSEDARVHKMPIEETARQSVIGGDRGYTPEAIEMAKTLEQGPVKASTAFRRYANDEALSREGSQGAFFTPPTRAQAFADAFGGLRPATRPDVSEPLFSAAQLPAASERAGGELAAERGAVNIAPLSEALERKFPEGVGGEPRSNYSGLGAARDKFIRNLSQLEEASPEAHAAAVRAATSRAQSAALLRSAMPRIEEALGGDVSPEDFRRALIEGRLQGLRQRWSELASDPRSAFANDPERPRRLLELLGHIEGKRGLPQDLRQTAASLMERSDVPTLESFLRETFTDAANSVAHAMDAGEFDRIRNAPGFRQGLATYKRLIEQPLAENHASNEGVFSDALGPLKTYYPLVPVKGSEEIMARSAARTPYSKPRNIANQFATGLGAQYDPSVAALGERIAAALRTNNRAALIDTLEQQGLLHRLDRGEQAGDAIEIGGQAYRASVVETAPSRTIIQNGKFATSPAERAVVPEWLDKELAPILQAKDLRIKVGLAQHLADAITALSLFGPTDISAHANNLLGTLVANTPFVGKSFLSAPFMKRFTATVKIIATDPTTAEAARDLGQMARLGVLPERYATETFSSKAAAQLGAERKYFSLGPLLYGPKGLDVRARLVMYRLAKELNPDATPLQMYKFVGQLDNYTRQLQSEIERSAKASGMAPFFTAGSQMVRNGVNAFLGTGPMPKSGVGLRIAQQLTGGAVGAVGMWAAAYRAYTGKWPWEDDRAKFLKIPVNDGDRRSWLGRKLWGDGPETGYVDFGYFNPLVARGARALGVSQAFDTTMAGGNARQVRESAATGPINAVMHPFIGPPARALFVGVTGQDPYVSGLRDREGRPGLQLLPADTKASSFPHLGAALREVSGIQGRLGEATGFLPATGMAEHGNPYFRMVADLAAPGLFAQASNVPGKAAALARERKSVDKAAALERQQRAQGAR